MGGRASRTVKTDFPDYTKTFSCRTDVTTEAKTEDIRKRLQRIYRLIGLRVFQQGYSAPDDDDDTITVILNGGVHLKKSTTEILF